MIALRPVNPADTEALVTLWRAVFPEYDDPTRPQRDPRANIERKLAFGDGLFWLAEREATLIGSVMAGYDGHRGWLYSLGVHPAERGRGLGRRLLQHAEQALAQRGCPKINLQVLTQNEGALAFWRSVGYQPDPVMSFGRRLA